MHFHLILWIYQYYISIYESNCLLTNFIVNNYIFIFLVDNLHIQSLKSVIRK